MRRTSFGPNFSIWLLTLFNLLLLAAGWIMAFYAYPRLPDEIPYWLNLAGQNVMKGPKGPVFFLYPLAQTIFFIAFRLGAKIWIKIPERFEDGPKDGEKTTQNLPLRRVELATNQKGSDENKAEIKDISSNLANHPGPKFFPLNKDKIIHKETKSEESILELTRALKNLKKELVLLLLIFFNLIFIHIQRSLIWLAHGLSVGVDKFYFFSLFIIVIFLIPYYRLRRVLLLRGRF